MDEQSKIKNCFKMGAYASDLVFAQQSATHIHQGKERTWAEEREGATDLPGRKEELEFLCLCLGESTKTEITHQW